MISFFLLTAEISMNNRRVPDDDDYFLSHGGRWDMIPGFGWVIPLHRLSEEPLYIAETRLWVLQCAALPAGQRWELRSSESMK